MSQTNDTGGGYAPAIIAGLLLLGLIASVTLSVIEPAKPSKHCPPDISASECAEIQGKW